MNDATKPAVLAFVTCRLGMANSGRQYSRNHIEGSARVHLGDVHNYVPSEREDETKNAKERRKLLGWLSQISTWDRYNEVLGQHKEGTSGWLFDDPKFSTWRENTCSSLLWLNGKMGSGKSMLAAVVLRELFTDSTIRTLFFFCDRTSRSAQLEDSVNIYRSLLRQMLQQWPEEQTRNLSDNLLSRKMQGHTFLSAPDCRKLITKTIKEISCDSRVVIIFDALDECGPELQRDLVLDWIRPLLEGLTVRILLSSRPETDVTPSLKDLDPQKILRIGNSNSKDIQKFVETEIGRLNLSSHKQEVEKLLIERSDGMFRWVQLAIRFLQARRSARESLEILRDPKSLPPGLPELYEKIYDQIMRLSEHDRGLVYRAFAYAMSDAWAYPLSGIEFVEAVYEEGLLDDPLSSTSELLLLCFDFLEHDKDTDRMRLAHLSVKEFLESKVMLSDLGSHLSLAKLCIRLARDFLDDENGRAWQVGRFICYAIAYWPHHLAGLGGHRMRFNKRHRSKELLASPTIDSQLSDLLFGRLHYSLRSFDSWEAWVNALLILTPIVEDEKNYFIQNNYLPKSKQDFIFESRDAGTETFVFKISRQIFRSTMFQPWRSGLLEPRNHWPSGQSNPLFVYACLGVEEITKVKRTLNDIACLSVDDAVSMPIESLMIRGFQKHDKFHSLFGKTTEASKRNEPVSHALLRWAPSSNDPATFSTMVRIAHSLDNVDNQGRTIIHELAKDADYNLLNLALARGGDVNCRDRWNRTPLFDALDSIVFAAVGAQPTDQGRFQAVGNTVELLLARGAKANLVDVAHETPLMVLFKMTRRWNLAPSEVGPVAALLIRNGTDLVQISEDGLTAHGILNQVGKKFSAGSETIKQWFWQVLKKRILFQIITIGTVPRCREQSRHHAVHCLAKQLKRREQETSRSKRWLLETFRLDSSDSE